MNFLFIILVFYTDSLYLLTFYHILSLSVNLQLMEQEEEIKKVKRNKKRKKKGKRISFALISF